MKLIQIFIFILHSFVAATSHADERRVYVVYFGTHAENKTLQEIEETHRSYLSKVKNSEEEAETCLIYSYKHSINGFAALLTTYEASRINGLEEVVSVFQSYPGKYSPSTTKSWELLGLEELNYENPSEYSIGRDMLLAAKYGKDVIVGVVDGGVWPELVSFNDEGMDPIPESWNRKCQIEKDFYCNRKIIGAKYYLKNFEIEYGPLNTSENSKSPRDLNGHGTHIASIIAGRTVRNVAALGGFAYGTASGGAPMSRLAIYKVCWRVPNEHKVRANDCLIADVLAGIDDAVSDGIDVLNISLESIEKNSHDKDEIAIGALHAVKKNIVVVCSAGNDGPKLKTVANVAPWVITVGASSLDRMFIADLALGNGVKIKGQSITPSSLTNMHELVYAGDVEHNWNNANAGKCSRGSLSPENMRGKIVLCVSNVHESKLAASEEVRRAGGVGVVLVDVEHMGVDFSLDTHLIPAILLTTNDATEVYKYIKHANNPMASIGLASTMKSYLPTPSIPSFTSRGPSIVDPSILKPDIVAPGLNILAGWSEVSSPTLLMNDYRRVKYNIQSGSSMATPHVAAVVVLLKSIHPSWTFAAIKSALMTSASVTNNAGSFISDYNGYFATPFAFGSGYIRPVKAADPGLVYDASYADHLTYFCSIGMKPFRGFLDPLFVCPKFVIPSYNLNYPSLLIASIKDIVKVQRTVTNVGDPQSKYDFQRDTPNEFLVEATPSTLQFNYLGQKKSFTITVTLSDTTKVYSTNSYAYGFFAWNCSSYYVRSPIMVRLA